jgi:nucleoside-diphosphate-sugar epimerase
LDKALIILGSSGNLGSKVAKHFVSQGDLHVYKAVRSSDKWKVPLITKISPAEDAGIKIPIQPEELKTNISSCDLTVINCSSGRYPFPSADITYANITWPRFLFDSLIESQVQKFNWLQFESYWQYTSSPVMDKTYVDTKNQFSAWLENEADRFEVGLVRVVLPHLFGRGDQPTRFIPRLLKQIQMGETVEISNALEIWPLTSFKDVIGHINNISQFFQDPEKLYLFPFHDVSLLDFAELAIDISGSRSGINQMENAQGLSALPKLSLSEQPILIEMSQTPLDVSIAGIFAKNQF